MYPQHEPVMIELQMRERLDAAERPILLERLVYALIESLLKRHNSAGRGRSTHEHALTGEEAPKTIHISEVPLLFRQN